MSLSEFQKKKLVNVYNEMYDSNKDGVIDQADFEDAMQKISALHHWGKNDAAYKDAQTKLQEVWEGLRKSADKNKDGKVTKDEWLDMWTKTLANIQAGQDFPDWQKKYIEFMFYANDTSGDGFIDRGEFITIQTLFGKQAAECEKAFDALSPKGNKDYMISKSDFEDMWKEYFLSSDENKRGNFLFGHPPK